MHENNNSGFKQGAAGVAGMFGGFAKSLAHGLMMMLFAFAIGTGAAALACWYYELPLVLSLGGGLIVLGLAVALQTDSLFS